MRALLLDDVKRKDRLLHVPKDLEQNILAHALGAPLSFQRAYCVVAIVEGWGLAEQEMKDMAGLTADHQI